MCTEMLWKIICKTAVQIKFAILTIDFYALLQVTKIFGFRLIQNFFSSNNYCYLLDTVMSQAKQ